MSTGKSIRGAISYNEQKVRQGEAELIFASHFSRDISEMGFSEKLRRFEKLTQLNEKSKTNTLHLSLNFSPEDNLDTELMQKLASDYMERIGFSGQPYLVYMHDDTAHPHLHIVTTTIRSNGKPIYLHNLAKRKSEPARKAMELEYGLIRAEGRSQGNAQTERKGRIENIVREVVSGYKFTSLDELNAILRQFNVIADRGGVNSRMFQNRGLVYSFIDKNGYKNGKSVKASSIFNSPTLSILEMKFEQNRVNKEAFQKFAKTKVMSAFYNSDSTDLFMLELKSKNIGCSVQYGTNGIIENISFIDHKWKSVFSCQDLGFDVNSLLLRFQHPQAKKANNQIEDKKDNNRIQDKKAHVSDHESNLSPKYTASFDIIKSLLTTEAHPSDISPEFLKKKRKKKKH